MSAPTAHCCTSAPSPSVCLPKDGIVVCVVRSCVEILISEQFRRYKEKMQNIQELEYAEALAVNQLKLKRQNTVRAR